MRHLLAVTFLILIFAVPWLFLNPRPADVLFSYIGSAGNHIAAVILAHAPKTIVELKARYNDKPGFFASKDSVKKVRVLLVPGHEPGYGGAEYRDLREREMNVEVANNLQEFLGHNSRYEVYTTRDKDSWDPIFSNYFKEEWNDIIAWKDGHKDEVSRMTAEGGFHPITPDVLHNSVPTDVALRLYGIGKWANESDMDMIIHIHFNDYPGHPRGEPGKYSGFAIYVPQRQYYNSSTTMALADTIFNRLQKYNPVSDFPGESSGIVEDPDLIAIGAYNSLNAPSMLIEYGYIYQPEFVDPLLHERAVRDLAFQTYLSLQDFFDAKGVTNTNGSFDTLVMPYTWKKPIADRGSDSADVFALQTALILDGVYPPADKSLKDCPRTGTVGACTKSAVEIFQKKRGIKGEEGVVGDRTLQELNRSYSLRTMQ